MVVVVVELLEPAAPRGVGRLLRLSLLAPLTRVVASLTPEAAEVAETPEAVETAREGCELSEVLRLRGCASRVKLGAVVVDVKVAVDACWSEKGSEPDSLRLPGTTLPLVNCM